MLDQDLQSKLACSHWGERVLFFQMTLTRNKQNAGMRPASGSCDYGYPYPQGRQILKLLFKCYSIYVLPTPQQALAGEPEILSHVPFFLRLSGYMEHFLVSLLETQICSSKGYLRWPDMWKKPIKRVVLHKMRACGKPPCGSRGFRHPGALNLPHHRDEA